MSAESAAAPEVDPSTRIVDGVKEFRITTTRGARFLLRSYVAQGGWYNGAKELSRRKKLGRAIGRDEPPTDKALIESWDKEACEFWLSDRLKEHARKCLNYMADRGYIQDGLDSDAFDGLMVELGMEIQDA